MKGLNYCRLGGHTEMPDGYVAQGEVAERMIAAGFKQKKCPECKRFALWYRPSGRRVTSYRNVSRKIRGEI